MERIVLSLTKEKGMGEPLTEKQIELWRQTLSLTLGPYAYLMSVEDIEKIRDNLQSKCANKDGELIQLPTYLF